MIGKYTMTIKTIPLTVPIGKICYFVATAKAYKNAQSGEQPVDYNFGETYGKTAEEAKARMHTIVSKWIRNQDEK